ncbi:polyhydroxyalkanoate synthesis regulator [Pradoshia eiseniae]|uniref:Polyhydroxyalkanoate synthesis regulator n=1 Tax=Pradoshia eiseniae TaxID=2064768 RepID=A0A2S7MW85_9BACI|nr:polyhydroxyalkanoate synthesis regulator [Pradoshia eiseniae]
MRDMVNKAFSFGLGAAIVSKEQIEKYVDEMVKRGEVSEQESKDMVNDLMVRGEERQKEFEQQVNMKVKLRLQEMDIATKEDIERLEQRIAALELKQNQQ